MKTRIFSWGEHLIGRFKPSNGAEEGSAELQNENPIPYTSINDVQANSVVFVSRVQQT
jgi:hypothetical protein